MRTRAGFAAVLALLIAAVPTVVSLCELRCVAAEVAAPHTVPPACSGHSAKNVGEESPSAPPGGSHDCAGHVLLAKGGATRLALQLDRAIAAAVPFPGSFALSPDQRAEGGKLEFTDLSPPLAPASDILRL